MKMLKVEMRDVDGWVRGPQEEEERENEEEKEQRGEDRDEAEGAGSETEVAAAAAEAEAEYGVGGDDQVRMGILGGRGRVVGGKRWREEWFCV